MIESRCPECGGPGTFLGYLGNTEWHECVDCGTKFSTEDNDDDTD